MFEIKSLKEELGGIDGELKGLAGLVATENRNFSEEEITRFDSLEAKKADLENKIKTAERVSKVGSFGAPAVVRSLSKSTAPTRRDYNLATKAWLLNHPAYENRIERSWKDAAERCGIALNSDRLIIRDPFLGEDLGTTNQGPELTDGSIFQAVSLRLKAYGGVRKVARVIQTENGNPIHWAYSDDTSNSASIVGEVTAPASVPQTFSKVTLGSYSFKTNVYPVSLELVQDAMIDVVSELGNVLGVRLGRGMNGYLTTGAGTTEPTGVVTAATLGQTTASSSAITYKEVNDLYHSLDPDYRDSASCAWMMNDATMGYLESAILDDAKRPLWLSTQNFSNMSGGNASSLLWGKPVIVNNQMESIGAGNTAILFGDFDKFIVRDVQLPTVQVLRERFADLYAVGVIAFGRMDSNAIDTNAIKSLVCKA